MLFIILLIGHLFADFSLQSSNMAENKQKNRKVLLAHGGIYLLVFTAINFVFLNPIIAIWTTLIICTAHFIIDYIRTKIDSRIESQRLRFLTFIVDQVLHVTTIIVAYYLLNLSAHCSSIYRYCESYRHFNKIIMYSFLFVALFDPAAVFVKKSFAFLFREEENNNPGNNAGSMIGKLERTITAILLLCNQYSAIGLVLTAKSIARFRQLENQGFAEKYLTGTLLSLSISLIATLAVKYVLSL